jgi:hypothetical protein
MKTHDFVDPSRFEMTLNYQVLVERCPFPNGMDGGSILVVKSSLYLMGKTTLNMIFSV